MSPAASSAGYSGTPLAKKLGIKPGSVVAVLDGPDDFADLVSPLPEGVTLKTSLRGSADLVVAFFEQRSRLEKRLPDLTAKIFPDGGLWLAWPKKASGVATDIDGGVVRELGLGAGVVDIKVCAIDETWSGHRFAHRRADRG